jgi:cellulose synthase/poly-beta-1,6-N-acetylglucosamine synthase-like glycosyltransferase
LYYETLQEANDAHGLAHFWGTSATFFLPALRSVGGFVYGCMTEDTVTGAQMHRFGWESVYLGTATTKHREGTRRTDKPLASGLVRESVNEACDQRKRWMMGK